MARSHYRGTVYGNLPTGAKPLAGAAIRLYHPDTGAPWALPVYPDPVNGTPYSSPILTNAVGELELWADEPARVRAAVAHPRFHSVGEVIEIRLDPGEAATEGDVVESVADHEAKTDAHPQYLTEEEGEELYKPLAWEPDLSDYYTRGEADDEFLDQDEADLRYEQLSRKGMPSGYAPLDLGGYIPNQYLPPLAITETFVAISEAEMLALPAQQGDVCVRLDTTENYILRVDPATVLENWTKLAASTTAGNTSVMRREEFTPAPLTTTVVLAAPPTTVHAVSRNGVGQSEPAGHYALAGLVLTFSDPFELGERVAVVYEIGSTVPAPVNGYTKEESDLRYLPLTGGTLSGQLSVANYLHINGGLSWLILDQVAGTPSRIIFRDAAGGALRWDILRNAVAEAGGNAGSDFEVRRYSDAGADLGTALFLSRATGAATFGGAVTTGPLTVLTETRGVTVADSAFGPAVTATSGSLVLSGSSGYVVGGAADGAMFLGHPSVRWSTVYGYSGDFATGLSVAGSPAISQATGDTRYSPLAHLHTGTYLPLTGGTLTGLLIAPAFYANVSSGGRLYLDGPPAQDRLIYFLTNGTPRWALTGNPTAETGGNAGSDLQLHRYDDAGNGLGAALTITRATGATTFGGNLGVAVAPAAWASSYRALQVGGAGSLWAHSAAGADLYLSNNSYYDGAGRKALQAAEGYELALVPGVGLRLATAPSVAAAGAAQTMTDRFLVGLTGQVTIRPTATENALQVQWADGGSFYIAKGASTATNARLYSTYSLELDPANNYVTPARYAAVNLGADNYPWLAAYAYGFHSKAPTNVQHFVIGGKADVITDVSDHLRWRRLPSGSTFMRWVYSVPGVIFDEFVYPTQDLTLDLGTTSGRWKVVFAGGINAQSQALGLTSTSSIHVNCNVYMHPLTDNTMYLGHSSYRFKSAYFADNIQVGSTIDLKEDIAPLDPVACADAVLGTDWVAYRTKPIPPPARGEKPEPTEQQKAGLLEDGWEREQEARQSEYLQALIETEPGRHQKGYVLQSPDHKVHDLFGLPDRKSRSDGADLAVVACALQFALQEIAALKAQIGAGA